MILMPGCGRSPEVEGESAEVLVFAAASLRDAVEDVARAFEREYATEGYSIVGNYAGSNALAQQIRATTRADVFLSANEAWMDDVQQAGRIMAETRTAFLQNRLVVVVAQRSDLVIDDPTDLAAPSVRHLSTGDPQAVPAGIYARKWLESVPHDSATLWTAVEERIVPGTSVRAALGLVESDERIAGIVYATDAAASERVRVAYEVPREETPEISYSIALLRDGPAPIAATEWIDFLLNEDIARAIFEQHGFVCTTPPDLLEQLRRIGGYLPFDDE